MTCRKSGTTQHTEDVHAIICAMKKKLDDKVLERTDDFYVAGQKHELQRTVQISETIGAGSAERAPKIPRSAQNLWEKHSDLRRIPIRCSNNDGIVTM